MPSTYKLKKVDNADRRIADIIKEMHSVGFPDYPMIETAVGDWWFAVSDTNEFAGFCALWPSVHSPVTRGYLARAAVLPGHRGQGLQRRFIRVRERAARAKGLLEMVSDTNSDNPSSANNLIRCGYRMWNPQVTWGHGGSIYWRKLLTKGNA